MNLLICSSATTRSLSLAEKVAALGFHPIVATTILEANKQLAAISFDAALVDTELGIDEATDLLLVAWKHNPLLYGALFSNDPPISQPWKSKLYGAQLFFGSDFVTQICSALKAFAKTHNHATVAQKRILFIEDLDAPRQIIEAYLGSLGYEHVVAFSDAQLALNELDSNPDNYFCVLSDIRMPNLDGIELIKRIRSSEKLRLLPVILLTAIPSIENVIEALKAGATGFLVKPPEKRLLRMEIEKAIRIFTNQQSPKLCQPSEAYLLEDVFREKFKML